MMLLAVLLAAAIMQPGDLIFVQAQCQTEDGATTQAGCAIVVRSPIYTDKPIYLAQGWERTNHLANGMLVRAHVRIGSEVRLVDGIQMSDGKVWVNNAACARVDYSPIPETPSPAAETTAPKEPQSEPPAQHIDEITMKEPTACRE